MSHVPSDSPVTLFEIDVAIATKKPRNKERGMQFEIRAAAAGQYYWRIVAANGQVLATSETYHNKADANSAAQSVKANAAGAPVYDYTATASTRR
jgi:uncharacterized protein YegP (UPF0339 family)